MKTIITARNLPATSVTSNRRRQLEQHYRANTALYSNSMLRSTEDLGKKRQKHKDSSERMIDLRHSGITSTITITSTCRRRATCGTPAIACQRKVVSNFSIAEETKQWNAWIQSLENGRLYSHGTAVEAIATAHACKHETDRFARRWRAGRAKTKQAFLNIRWFANISMQQNRRGTYVVATESYAETRRRFWITNNTTKHHNSQCH